MVIWITGLSGAGKTTLAKEIVNQLATENKELFCGWRSITGNLY